jgi:O-antigen/teichoic acid export membrane protein
MSNRIRYQWRDLLIRVRGGGFLANVLVLAGGTGLSQLVLILASPFLTRLYSPSEFGVLAVFSSTLGLLAVVATLRYEFAIPLPESTASAINLLAANGLVLVGTSVLTGIMVFFFGDDLVTLLSIPELAPFLWLLPVGMFAAGGVQSLTYWFVRQRQFKRLTQARVGQSLTSAGGQLFMGWQQMGSIGLVGGNISGRIVADIILFVDLVREDRDLFKHIRLSDIKRAAWRYRRFPLISSWSGLLNQSGLQLPTLLFASFFGVQAAGWYGLAQRIAGIPITLIAYSVSQVYFSEASRLRNENPKEMRRLFLRIASKLLLFVGAPLVIGGLTAPWLFGFVFGEKWRISGWYIVALLPMFLGQIVVRPLSQSLNILERQDLQLYWDIGRLIAIIGAIGLSHFVFHLEMMGTLALYSLSMLVMYLIYFVVMFIQITKFNPISE